VSQTDLRNELTELCELSIPSLVIHGRHDPIPLETAEQVAGCLGASLEVFEESGHVPYVEDFEEFVQVLDGFLPKQQ
jgi:proline iminopeptidase